MNWTKSTYSPLFFFSLLISYVLTFSWYHKDSHRELASLVPEKRIILLYSDIGAGHISAAKAIEKNILAESPKSVVVQKNIRDFMSSRFAEKVDRKLYMFIFEHFPSLLDYLYKKTMSSGNKIDSLAFKDSSYDQKMLLKFINEHKADVVIATHYGAAELLGNLRESGKLPNTKVAWLHTDYIEGYFPRISERLDDTFLAHKKLTDRWLESGIAPSKVHTTGLPINPKIFEVAQSQDFLTKQGLDPNKTTISISTGGDGTGDYVKMIKSISEEIKGPVQIIAITAKNKKELERINQNISKGFFGKEITVKAVGFIPQEDLLSFVKASDIYVTKGGGLSPTEGFAIGKPIVLLEIAKAHEAENLKLFEELKLASISKDQSKLGKTVKALLQDQSLQSEMLKNQSAFISHMNLNRITNFALSNFETTEAVSNFGVEASERGVVDSKFLKKLEEQFPSDFEILLSDATQMKNKYRLNDGENPFGHIAFRFRNEVYTALTGPDDKGVFHPFFKTDYYTYLVGNLRDVPGQIEQTNQFGQLYGRHVYSIRIDGLTSAQELSIKKEILKIMKEGEAGLLKYSPFFSNCGHYTDRVLKAAGINVDSGLGERLSKLNSPLTLFENLISYFKNNKSLNSQMIAFTKMPNPNGKYKFSLTPLTPFQPVAMIKNLIKSNRDKPNFYSEIDNFVHFPSEKERRMIIRNTSQYKTKGCLDLMKSIMR